MFIQVVSAAPSQGEAIIRSIASLMASDICTTPDLDLSDPVSVTDELVNRGWTEETAGKMAGSVIEILRHRPFSFPLSPLRFPAPATASTVFVAASSRVEAERTAKTEPQKRWETEQDARAFLCYAGDPSRDRVYRASVTQDGNWIVAGRRS